VSYTISVDPSTIGPGDTATVTVGLPDEEPVVYDIRLIRRSDGEAVGTGSVTFDQPDLTVGLPDGTSDYYVEADGPFTLTQSGPFTFTLTYE
jgi:hypothetical protein